MINHFLLLSKNLSLQPNAKRLPQDDETLDQTHMIQVYKRIGMLRSMKMAKSLYISLERVVESGS